jgi:hypothetical protein
MRIQRLYLPLMSLLPHDIFSTHSVLLSKTMVKVPGETFSIWGRQIRLKLYVLQITGRNYGDDT